MKKRIQLIFVLLTLTSLLLPSNTVLSQDDWEFDDFTQFIWNIMTINALGGDSVAALSNTRDATQTYFSDIRTSYENNDNYKAIAELLLIREYTLTALNGRVMLAEERARQDAEKAQQARDAYSWLVVDAIYDVLYAGADSVNKDAPAKASPVIAKILPVLEKQTKQNAADTLYGHISSRIPDSSSAIASSSSQIYHVDAGFPTPLPPSLVSEVDTPEPPPSAPIILPTVSSVGNSGGSDISFLKPLRFTNKGLYDATVRAFSYTPAEGVTASMSGASTVVFRDSNPTAYLDLPLGTYVFCYDWDLGTDADNDGYVDYAHKNTGSVTLSASSSDDTNSAQVITLNPGSMNNPNGKCGENAPQPSENAGGLTPQELANQGTHTYRIDCPTEEGLGAEASVIGFKFVAGGVNVEDENDEWFYNKINVNTYTHAYTGDFVGTYTFTFTNEGFTMLLVADGSGTCIGTRK